MNSRGRANRSHVTMSLVCLCVCACHHGVRNQTRPPSLFLLKSRDRGNTLTVIHQRVCRRRCPIETYISLVGPCGKVSDILACRNRNVYPVVLRSVNAETFTYKNSPR